MAKPKTVYVCSQCGNETAKWYGKCPDCGAWNSMEETVRQPEIEVAKKHSQVHTDYSGATEVVTIQDIVADEESRHKTSIKELDRVMGGGIVRGSVTLLSGDPGIGKSTLLLQMCQPLCQSLRVLYVSGEESAKQIKLRARRLGVDSPNLLVAAVTQVGAILGIIEKHNPDVVMIDSIQTIYLPTLNSSAGTVTQIRECTQLLMTCAKSREFPLFLVGHVNKDGAIAGPKVMEHMVDTVLYFEGERHLAFRILRAVKNRFGSTNEIGVFKMGTMGLEEVGNPSFEMISGRPQDVSGSCIACVMEGSRPILAEVQALVCKSGFGTPRRMSTGFDFGRSALIIAVLEKRCGYFFGNLDAYINVVGGLRLDEPAADLPVAMALISNLIDKPIPYDFAAFGEIGLTGELRSVSHVDLRVNEAYRLGFRRFVIPRTAMGQLGELPSDIRLIPASNLRSAFSSVFEG
ncbi:MAG: DNA repair protein RadA [Clostridiales bacterium]|uniref:DNA repair protein RadA n=1 Tax=Oscillospiraceae TaxID=216572 RepID=UPI0009A69100|nr:MULTISPECIES: DNA repair protein RadA [Oscillospiraceae]PWM39257.1 MAG: DNA repair protein RadA [Clostridiales bacterium]RGB69808.1 DNA repair protein RadA [Harryflintia acetispora]